MKQVIKHNGQIVPFDFSKIEYAVRAAMQSVSKGYTDEEQSTKTVLNVIKNTLDMKEEATIDEIQKIVEDSLMCCGQYDAARSYIEYRKDHKDSRFIADRIDYMNHYALSNSNAATSSETDANANVTMKNVANLEGEVYKSTNRIIQRQRMKDSLNKLFPEVAKQYEKDIEHHIIYPHDEATTPVLKPYCMAASLFPLMTTGVGNIDGVTPTKPDDLQSFSGQITNLAFLLSSQCKGAVAFGEYFIALNYYVVQEFGEDWYNHLDDVASTDVCKKKRTVRSLIIKAFKQFVWGINQPAGNRGFQSPFTNISYYDKTYFKSLFGEFAYPDGSKPEWKAIDTLQRMFMNFFNELRLKQILTFPVETFAMVHDHKDVIDKDYKELCAEMYSKGHSFFTYLSDSADSLASCCRLRNELGENTFNPTSGLTGVMTGSCNVITLNINRIVQDWYNKNCWMSDDLGDHKYKPEFIIKDASKVTSLKQYLINILERVYKYHIAYKTMLYDLEDQGMLAASNGGYIYMNKLYSTVGINGLNEAARFLGLEVSNNPDYIEFLQFILGTVKEQNKLHSIQDKKRPFLFNSEVVPAEGLGGKNYNWDKEDGLEPMSI